MKVIVLGSGTSQGVPEIGCSCRVCTSPDGRDKRMRSSVYICGDAGERLLIDAGPEFRLQALRAGIKKLDGILLSHSHADHMHGLDDLRPLSWRGPVPIYGNSETIAELKERFSYVFNPTGQRGGGRPKLEPRIIDGPVEIGSLHIRPVPVKHGSLDILGWEIHERGSEKSFLYLTDTSAIPEESLGELRDSLASKTPGHSRVLIIGGLRVKPHETHFTFEAALDAALGLGAEQIYLTHICHEHDHLEIEGIIKNFMETRTNRDPRHGLITSPAWDGLELEI